MSTTPSRRPEHAHAVPEQGPGQDKLDALVRLSGAVAHDFNNILHVIRNAVELLRHKVPPADPDAARLLDMLNRNAARGSRLTRELLAVAARQPLSLAAVNASRVIADMQHLLRDTLGRSVQIETSLGGSLWPVYADAKALEAMVLKLAENSRDAMGGAGTIAIETANHRVDEAHAAASGIAAGDYVCIKVRDTGAGMSAETLRRAFDPYFTTKEHGPLTGLGLSHVHGLVRQLGGRIVIESAPGAGTTVSILLPRYEAAAVPAAGPGEDRRVVPLSPSAAPRSLDGLRVLVVEDESLIGMLAEDLLEQLGCRMVGLVSSVGKALEVAKGAEIDLALLDVDIGGEPVYPVASALQKRGVPFLFMSGYGGLEEPWRGRPIVQKPFDLDQLRREMERVLGAKP